MARECRVTRVFTRGEEGGNHLGVVLDAADLDGDDMQRIAADLRFSETIFVVDASAVGGPDGEMGVRIFTPGGELPFAGHPMVGITWVLAQTLEDPPTTLHCAVGPIGVRAEGDAAWIDVPINQPVILDAPDVHYRSAVDPVRTAVVEMPVPYELFELPAPDDVAAAPVADYGMVYVFAWEDDASIKARFFAPGHGVTEDPATGSAAVGFVALQTALGADRGSVTIHQGDEVGFPSTISAAWADGTVSLGGTVVFDEVRSLNR